MPVKSGGVVDLWRGTEALFDCFEGLAPVCARIAGTNASANAKEANRTSHGLQVTGPFPIFSVRSTKLKELFLFRICCLLSGPRGSPIFFGFLFSDLVPF